MNRNISCLLRVSEKESRLIIGLMSGTSLDGLDIALCRFTGSGSDTKFKLLNFRTVPYTNSVKETLSSVVSQRTVDLQDVCILHSWIGSLHGQMVLDTLKLWDVDPGDVDLVASHGQTVYHAPKSLHAIPEMPNSTLQLGDGDHIAVKTGIITISDFRQKHVANGMEGAPLAFFGDFLLFSKRGQHRITLNVGGIANFTFLPGNLDVTNVFCSDTGPGNTLIDSTVRQIRSQSSDSSVSEDYDKDGEMARRGHVHESLLAEMKSHPFFQWTSETLEKGKTTGRELFNTEFVERAQLASKTGRISDVDLIATLTRLSAETISDSVRLQCSHRNVSEEKIKILTSGGGKNNLTLKTNLRQLLPSNFEFEDMNEEDALDSLSDAKEAILFATLANETVCGENIDETFKGFLSMGKISFPL